MKKYGHLTLEERSKIEVLLKLEYSQRQIAKLLGRSQSTISVEIRRNTKGKEWYLAFRANERATRRSYYQRKQAPLKEVWIWEYVLSRLKKRWSPEAICGRLWLEHGVKLHHETIYRYVYSVDGQRNRLYQYLKLHRKKRMRKYGRKVKRQPIKNRVMIDQRPTTEGFGHWETDNMEGVRSDRKSVSVTIERETRYMRADVVGRDSRTKTKHIVKRLSNLPVKTLTTDNGSENARHITWKKKLGVDVYFCNPYHSWEKGAVENAIGRIRKYIPKKQSIEWLTNQKLQRVVDEYNETPRKCLKYLTPKEEFMRQLQTPSDRFPLRI